VRAKRHVSWRVSLEFGVGGWRKSNGVGVGIGVEVFEIFEILLVQLCTDANLGGVEVGVKNFEFLLVLGSFLGKIFQGVLKKGGGKKRGC
jgi:hypothetical protein